MTRKLLGEKLRQMRKKARLSQDVMAKDVGVSIRTIKNVEYGRNNVEYMTIKKMLDRFGMTLTVVPKTEEEMAEDMFGGDEEIPKNEN